MKALARLPPAANGSARPLDLLCAFWLFCLPEIIHAIIPNKKEMNEVNLQQTVDCLKDAHMAAARHINAVTPIPPATPPDEEDIAVINKTPAQQQTNPQPRHQ